MSRSDGRMSGVDGGLSGLDGGLPRIDGGMPRIDGGLPRIDRGMPGYGHRQFRKQLELRQQRRRLMQGVGIGLRREHYAELLACSRRIDWLEIVPENYVDAGGRHRAMLDACCERWPVLAHGVSVSVGGPDPLPSAYLTALRALLERIDAPFYTDHLCYAAIDGTVFHDLLPLPFTDEAVRHTATRIRELADRLERPVAVENITYYATMPGSAMSEGEFVTAVCEEADCGLLLDVNNAYVNAMNHGLDPLASLLALPLSRTRQIHLAGHVQEGPRLLDNHGHPVDGAVWALYRAALQRLGPIPTLLEWDTCIPPLDRVLDEADMARTIYQEVAQR